MEIILEKVHPYYNWHYKDCLTQAQVVTEGINTSTALENSYNLMQSFIQAVETGNTHELKLLINCQDQIGTLMHKTLLTFKHNLKAVLNGAKLPYSNGCLEGFNRKIKQIERTAFGYSNFINLLTRIKLEENRVKKRTKQFINCLILIFYSSSTPFLIECQVLLQRKKEYTKHNPKRLVFWQFFTYCVLSIY